MYLCCMHLASRAADTKPIQNMPVRVKPSLQPCLHVHHTRVARELPRRCACTVVCSDVAAKVWQQIARVQGLNTF